MSGHETMHYTDAGNSRRFARLAKNNLRYCPERGWLEWDKKVITLTHLGDAAFIKASEGREEVE